MSEHVHQMFSQIAPRYDAANDLLSFGTHRLWKRKAVKLSLAKPGDAVLDCATGTGDVALAFKRVVGASGRVIGTDFNAEMLKSAPDKAKAQNLDVAFQVADAMNLPFDGATFDISCISFGIRNVDNPTQCLKEMARVLKPGGRVVVLEFGQPTGPFGLLFRPYAKFVMPLIGQLLSGNREAYEYLPRTAAAFPANARFLQLMDDAQAFQSTAAHALMAGLAYIYVGVVK